MSRVTRSEPSRDGDTTFLFLWFGFFGCNFSPFGGELEHGATKMVLPGATSRYLLFFLSPFFLSTLPSTSTHMISGGNGVVIITRARATHLTTRNPWGKVSFLFFLAVLTVYELGNMVRDRDTKGKLGNNSGKRRCSGLRASDNLVQGGIPPGQCIISALFVS